MTDPLLLTRRVCPACDLAESPVRGSGLQGKHQICQNCFMIWYDSGITDSAVLGKESRWRRDNDYWPWGERSPTYDEFKAFRTSVGMPL